MNVLLLRPDPGNERFGLGPFFRVEPLGLEYLAAAVEPLGVDVSIGDLRYRPSLRSWMRRARPRVVGLSCMHALEYDATLAVAREVRRLAPDVFIVVGGHAAGTYPQALYDRSIDAICIDDAEEVFPQLLEALAGRRSLQQVPALLLRMGGDFVPTPPLAERTDLDRVPLPARGLVSRYRKHYLCLNYQPVWLLETARGCPYRCSFCSVWQLYDRSFRERSIGAVVDDFATVGPNVFVADDLFWNHAARSRELALALRKRGIRKRWVLVQARGDTVARRPELLDLWRPIADRFDIFFGFETPTDRTLAALDKDTDVAATLAGVQAARAADYGITGNFVIDPTWHDEDFERLWDFVAEHGLRRSGFTILTPLPGTTYYEQVRALIGEQPWFKYDMHHLLWEPQIGTKRFFELFAETWRRSVLNIRGDKKLSAWIRQIEPRKLPMLMAVLLRTQRQMNPEAYLREHGALPRRHPLLEPLQDLWSRPPAPRVSGVPTSPGRHHRAA
ncbi:MAG: cobalamin-dependent protein [Deltaproteobacteria bacterium]|jgi:radical SAM superfamily enzyme YgiQ (UPF0313 family)|nr:cobalamin-dependent protein [Deltaproteobacteria bacterium]MBW2534540.1 cobalamin-dependent protein [Deltaproteobacteria bacterium]